MAIHSLAKCLFIGVVMTISNMTTGFLLTNDHCVVPAPCGCSTLGISCVEANLTDVPTFVIVGPPAQGQTFHMGLNRNSITTVPRNAFMNISMLNPQKVVILLHDNDISSIDSEAFTGIQHVISLLSLDANKLTSLPAAIGTLDHLQRLYVRNNPLSFIDPSILSRLGMSLVEFSIGMHALKTWPNLSQMQNMTSLHIDFIPFRDLSTDAFPTSLERLTVDNSSLASVPNAVCSLERLIYLKIALSSELISNNTLDIQCPFPLDHLKFLEIHDSNFNTFTKDLLSFPSVERLLLRNNNIRFIHNDHIQQPSLLRTISLSHNSLSRIPPVLKQLTNITALDLSYNNITTVGDHDLTGLMNLFTLYLGNNPISHIASNAFKYNTQIRKLYLDNTKLHLVPETVRYLTSLFTFDFSNNSAECSCRLSYLQGWDASHIWPFSGMCADRQNVPIKQYLMTQLSQCQ